MRLLIHDYGGYPFSVQLSRELASRGYNVLYTYAGYNVTPRGELTKRLNDPALFEICPIFIRHPLQKYNFARRWLQEREYGQLLARRITQFQPDVVISADTPLDAQVQIQQSARKSGAEFIFWLQDVIGLAAQHLLQAKKVLGAGLIGAYFVQLERILLRKSDHVVLITEDFRPLMIEWGIDPNRMTVIPNWAPIDSLPVLKKDNAWAQKYGLDSVFCFMYTGTLGMKHNPEFLLQLASRYAGNTDVRIVVLSEGPGADWLQEKKVEYQLDNLLLLPYQPFEQIPQVMATADVLVALLKLDAGIFSAPSKVLTYLCAQRPLLLAVPQDNLSARIVSEANAGSVTPPQDFNRFLEVAEQLRQDGGLREIMASNARAYAEANFDIKKIADRFEEILLKVC
jgi:glycosyltransferase involved in cell wall biosynthesis